MENEANGLTDSSVARHSTDRTLRLELISRNQNGSRHDQGTGMGAEVRNIEYSIALKIKRGELMVPVWDYVAGRLGEGGRCKSNSPKLKLRSQLLFTATQTLELWGRMIQKLWSQRLRVHEQQSSCIGTRSSQSKGTNEQENEGKTTAWIGAGRTSNGPGQKGNRD